MDIPKPTGEVRRTVLVQLPDNDTPNGVHVPDHAILHDELLRKSRFDGFEGPFINGIIAVNVEQYGTWDATDEELISLVVGAVHRALFRTANPIYLEDRP